MAAGMAVAVLGMAGPARGQSQLQLWGELGLDVRLDRTVSDGRASTTEGISQRYSLGVDGVGLDPRLLTYSLGGAFSDATTEFDTGSSDSTVLEPYRAAITLFPAGRLSLTLRSFRSESETSLDSETLPLFRTSTTESTVEEYGATLRMREQGLLPEVTLDVRRTDRASRQPGPDFAETSWAASLSARKRLARHDLFLGYEFETRESNVPGQSGDRHGIRLEDRIGLGARGQLSAVLDYRSGQGSETGQAGLTLTGPLGPSTDGTASLSYGVSRSKEVATYTTAGSGTLVRRFGERLVLVASGFGVLTEGSGRQDQSVLGGQGSASWAPWTPLRLSANYNASVFDARSGGSVSQSGSASASLAVSPQTSLFLEYAFTETRVERAEAPDERVEDPAGRGDRTRHAIRTGVDATPAPWLVLRGEAEYFTERSTLGDRTDEHGYTVNGSLSLRPRPWLTGQLSAHLTDRTADRRRYETLTTLASVQVLVGRLALAGEVAWERDDLETRTRLGYKATLAYRLGLWQLSAEYQYTTTDFRGGELARESAILRVARPFRFWLL